MSRSILFIRRENIGDLVCTTPLIRAVRARHPDAHIAVFANDYNAPVVEGNTDINVIHRYTKGKHADGIVARLGSYVALAKTLWRLRRQRFDDIVIGDPAYSRRNITLAKFLKAGRPLVRIIGFEHDDGTVTGLDVVFPQDHAHSIAISQLIFRMAAAWGIDASPDKTPPVLVIAPADARPRAAGKRRVIGVHISARKPSQRWHPANFIALIEALHGQNPALFRLYWSPGAASNPLHPGDDEKAADIVAALRKTSGVELEPVPTASLGELISALASVDLLVCADGGAMHIAAGLGIPLVCLFGDSDSVRWRPWGVPCTVLQRPSREVNDIPVAEVSAAVRVQFEKDASRSDSSPV